MAIVSTTIFKNVADRVAGHYKLMVADVAALNALGSTSYYAIITASNDSDVEIPFGTPSTVADAITVPAIFAGGALGIKSMITAMNAHFTRVAYTGGINQFCIDNDFRVSDYFNQVYTLLVGNSLKAVNVFDERNTTFATVLLSAGPAIGYTPGSGYGSGAVATRLATSTVFAATQLQIHCTVYGGAAAHLTIHGTGPDDSVITATAVITGTGFFDVGSTTDRFLTVTSVTFTDGNHGTVSDNYIILNKHERTI